MLYPTCPHRDSSLAARRAVTTAAGYLVLRMHDEARHELDALGDAERTEPIVLRLRARLHLYERDWEIAERFARNASALHPEDHEFAVQRVFALYQLDRTRDARRVLRRAPRWLHDAGLLHYNLACYEALIGDPATARECAKAAFALNPVLKRRALKDPDLRAFVAAPKPPRRRVTLADSRKSGVA